MPIRFKTPKGIAIYPSLVKPSTKFDPEGTYETRLRLTPEQSAPLLAEAKECAVEEFGKKAARAEMNFKKDDETGDLIWKFKSKKRPALYDGKGKLVTVDLDIGSGSEIKVQGTFAPYKKGAFSIGVTAYLNAVMICKLVGSNPNPFGDEDKEDGFESTDEAPFSAEDAEEA